MSSPPDSEPRPDLRHVLSALVAGLRRMSPDRDLQAVFEHELQQLLSMRSVRLREIPTRYQARLVTPTRTTDSIVLGVPTANPRVQAVLEAYFEPGRPIEDRDFAMLKSAAELGGLVLEATRTRSLTRATAPDGAAPLIGSTAVMRNLRDRIERVAITDFTVLIHGESWQ
jgi:transcriptional regulator with PAS, ATPase and Fis domain